MLLSDYMYTGCPSSASCKSIVSACWYAVDMVAYQTGNKGRACSTGFPRLQGSNGWHERRPNFVYTLKFSHACLSTYIFVCCAGANRHVR